MPNEMNAMKEVLDLQISRLEALVRDLSKCQDLMQINKAKAALCNLQAELNALKHIKESVNDNSYCG